MTQNVVRFSRGVDLTARRSWRAIQKMQIARQLPERPTTGFFRRRFAHHVQIAVQPPSDLSLLRSIANGDRNALGTLFSRHKERVFRFALAIAKDRSLADDVVSDVFLDVARHASSFEGRSQVSTWLLAITRNKALSSLRRNARNRSNEELTESIVDTAQDPEAALQAKQTGRILAGCILQLPAIHREMIDLVYYHRKSIKEIAEILNIPESTVKSRMFHARKRLGSLVTHASSAPETLQYDRR